MLPLSDWRDSFDERYPIYRQIVSRFSRSLVRGEISPGDRIPSIREMALALKVNTNTIQRAYQEMEREKLIFSQRGTGFFVMNDSNLLEKVKRDTVRDCIARFLAEMSELGFDKAQIISLVSRSLEKEDADNAADDRD